MDSKKLYSELNNIYLDASSTTPILEDVITSMLDVYRNAWANPSSIHNDGLKASDILYRSRVNISTFLNAKEDDLVFTSGATESVHLGLLGIARSMEPGRFVISDVEHPCVRHVAQILSKEGWDVYRWPVDKNGVIELNQIEHILKSPTKLVSIIWGQSEIGSIQPIDLIGKICRDEGIIFHTDATQILFNFSFNWQSLPIDMLSASAHKFQGPKGIGILLARKNILNSLIPLQGGGMQENGLRSGTESASLSAGMSKALSLLYTVNNEYNNEPYYSDHLRKLRTTMHKKITKIHGISFTGHPLNRLNNHLSILVGDSNNNPLPSNVLVLEMARKGISISSGTACSIRNKSFNNTLKAIGIEKKWLNSGIRFSLGPWLEESDIDFVCDQLVESINNVAS